MKIELQKKIFKKFPKLFAQKDLSMKQTCMCWGIETPDEWYDIIYTACEQIQGMIDDNKHLSDKFPQIEFTQVKEKWGGLRMYYDNSVDYYDGIIDMADAMVQKLDPKDSNDEA